LTLNAHLKIVSKTGGNMNMTQHAVGCEYIHTMGKGCQSAVYSTVGVSQELRDEFIATHNGKPPLLTKAIFRTVRDVETS
jgi:hypothetical protein